MSEIQIAIESEDAPKVAAALLEIEDQSHLDSVSPLTALDS